VKSVSNEGGNWVRGAAGNSGSRKSTLRTNLDVNLVLLVRVHIVWADLLEANGIQGNFGSCWALQEYRVCVCQANSAVSLNEVAVLEGEWGEIKMVQVKKSGMSAAAENNG
jgi:hypothetical protein